MRRKLHEGFRGFKAAPAELRVFLAILEAGSITS